MDTFNLNVDDYSDNDIVSLLSLNETYTFEDIEKSKEILKYQLLKNVEVDSEKKSNLILFLDTISECLSNKLTNKHKFELPINSISKHGGNILINKKDKLENFDNLINKRKTINIDSRFRKDYINTKSNNFDFELLEKENNVKNIFISDIDIPSTYNTISHEYNNNTLLIDYYDNIAIKIVLNDGKYKQHYDNNVNMISIIDSINDIDKEPKYGNIEYGKIVNNNFVNNGNSDSHYNIFLTIDKLTNKVKIENLNNKIIKSIKFNINSNGIHNSLINHQLTLGWLLGFNKSEYNNDTTNTFTITSERSCIALYPRYTYISINDYQTNYTGNIELSIPYSLKLDTNAVINKNIITKLNLINDLKISSAINLPNQLNRKRSYYSPVDIQKLTIALYDEYGRYLDLNNTDWSFSLILEYK
tara:strand:+ start:83 stop:1333 length:1251 start_codon:yes stop_codon:yes gene_type:complete